MTHQIIVLDSSLETYLYDSVLRLIIIFYIYINIYTDFIDQRADNWTKEAKVQCQRRMWILQQ